MVWYIIIFLLLGVVIAGIVIATIQIKKNMDKNLENAERARERSDLDPLADRFEEPKPN